jgi:hypothetical protein
MISLEMTEVVVGANLFGNSDLKNALEVGKSAIWSGVVIGAIRGLIHIGNDSVRSPTSSKFREARL